MFPKTKVAVIGSGPIGIDAAVALTKKGYDVTIYEKGPSLASNMSTWEGVTLFSPNRLNCSKLGLEVLREMDVPIPTEDEFFSGRRFMDSYLRPLESYLLGTGMCSILYNTEVVSVSRDGMTKRSCIGDKDSRSRNPFTLLLSRGDEEWYHQVHIVFDASGNYINPNFAGKGGMPALGELKLRKMGMISYYIPDMDSIPPPSPAEGSKPTFVVIGAGTSAITSLKRLSQLDCNLVWVTHSSPGVPPFALINEDPLPQRNELFHFGNSLADKTATTVASFDYRCGVDVTKFKEILSSDGTSKISITLTSRQNGAESPESNDIIVDKIFANVGYRPDMSLSRELQVHYCWASEGPMKLAAALLAANGAAGGGDCLAQVNPGVETLLNPEPNYYVVGMKSYGRGNSFLMRIGYEQVESIVAILEPYPVGRPSAF